MSAIIHIGPRFSVTESQLVMCIEMGMQEEAITAIQNETLLKEAYSAARIRLGEIMKDISKKDTQYILKTHYPESIQHSFISLDACLARMSLFTFSATTTWTLVDRDRNFAYCIVASDKNAFSGVYVASTGDFHTTIGGNAMGMARDLLEKEGVVGQVLAIVCTKRIKQETCANEAMKEKETVQGEAAAALCAAASVAPAEISPAAPTATPSSAQSAEEGVAPPPPAAPVKKKIIRKRVPPPPPASSVETAEASAEKKIKTAE